ncbi:MAG: ice-binding family protein [Syntrophales bacterium]
MKVQILKALTAVVLFLLPNVNFGQAAPPLGAAESFALFTSAGALDNLGATSVTGDIGSNSAAVTGFPPGVIVGTIYNPPDPTLAQAAADVSTAYGLLSGMGGSVLGTTIGNNDTLTAGVYLTGGAATLNGNLYLDGQGDPDALFIIRIGGALSTSTFSNVFLINSASLCNVYWQIMGAFSLGGGSVFRGTIVGGGAISLLEGSSLLGRGLTTTGAIDLHNNLVTIALAPVATASNNGPVCVGSSLSLTGGPASMTSYAWTGPNGFTSTSQSPTVSANATTAMAGTYSLTVTDGNGCTSIAATTTVTVNALPVATASNNGPVCVGSSLNLTGGPASMTSYAWTGPNGFTSTSQSPTVSANATTAMAGTYSLTVTDGNGCTSIAATTTVTVNPLPAAAAGADTTICLNASTQIGEVTVTGSTYSWTSLPAGFTSTEANPTVTPLITTTYIVVETITATGCQMSNSVTVTVNLCGTTLVPISTWALLLGGALIALFVFVRYRRMV